MGLGRDFDCSDQRELEYCHPYNVGEIIGYLPNTDATWLTPATLEEIEYVIINQPGDAPTVMNFQENFGYILAMAGFLPSAEFYAPDPNPDLIGTPYEGVLIRQQVLGEYVMTDVPPLGPMITSSPVTNGQPGADYSYQVTAVAYPGPLSYSLPVAPAGMGIDEDGLITWVPDSSGSFDVVVEASNGLDTDSQAFQVMVGDSQFMPVLDDFNRANGALGDDWKGDASQTKFRIDDNMVQVLKPGHVWWASSFGASQEAYFTFEALSPNASEQGLFLKFTGSSPSAGNASLIMVMYDHDNGVVRVVTRGPGSSPRQGLTITWAEFPATFDSGDQLAAQALADGTVIVYKNGAPLGSVNVSGAGAWTLGGGSVGARFMGLSGRNSARFDDFGGGTLP